MSDYHILNKAVDNKTARVVVHLPIPNENNIAGVNRRTALVEKLTQNGETIVSQVPNHAIDFPADETLLQYGGLYEKAITFRFSSLELTNLGRRDEIRAHVAQMKADIVSAGTDLYNEVIEPLQWWGYNENVT